ncbi:bifunctional UDP-sugar hydrolase/5'-nucleotidase UshA [Shewanella colwelliana]|uniref:Bifunctional UDP-sugar hydrolase/5'-nucleotidase n=1 Tax=Shewanella colwelliana TaxID=23 RepID=A0A1E5IZQ4_SHECO|nr:bifunctional UDP-sugar hydrolase/5'-nucleotidase UshA [Shewanella colwelliana]MDX1282202.1 bifunctional UDP-sugar hydrolase/5'-nucleotidase UshA [Shewanella colwelliana]OEG75967.1 bifunctional UDP-sugar hydrolase/5'-nucleotidase [Shewanella colwelliana]GIU42068.1 bifunctional metallophosphatase/5'-nucleotidase [Shewanella colwelliana]
MTNKILKGLVATAVLAALAGCNSSDDDKAPTTCAEAGDACTTFTVLHTNDNHGRFFENKYGEYGMAARKTLIDQIRAEVESNGGETLLLSGGDINTGVPESDLQDARPDFVGMNLIGYDAMAVGNHEFDNPLSVVDMQRDLAEFPMLAANIYDKETGERYFDAYKVFDVNGVRIAVVGLTTEDTAKIANPEFIGGLEFTDPKEELKKVIKQIKDANEADLIFATTHMGHYADGVNGNNAPGDVALARAMAEGELAAVIGGHSQNPVCMEGNVYDPEFTPGGECKPDVQNGTFIMQAHEWGKYVGQANFEYFNGELHLASYKLIPVNLKEKNEAGDRVHIGEPITPDATVLEVMQQYQDKGQEELLEVIGSTDDKLEGDRGVVRNQQTNLGRLLAEAQRTKVAADFAVMNSGGVRDSIQPGEITYKDVLTVQPFGNSITLSTLTGAEVTDYLNVVATVDVGETGSGAYPQLVGIKMDVDCEAKTVAISDINGKGYAADATYTFTVPSYNAAGGDGYPVLTPVMTGYVDAEVLYTYIKNTGDIKAADYAPVAGDIQFLNSKSPLACKF